MTRAELSAAVREMCETLVSPLPPQERELGWSESDRLWALSYFEQLERDLNAGVRIPFFSLVRALDSCGINKGNLLEEMCRINNAVNAMSR
jgi:hypothetical protein